MKELEEFYLRYDEPLKSTYQALRKLIVDWDSHITEHWKYKVPFFYYQEKPFCYLWKDKKTQQPYIGIVKGEYFDHAMLQRGNRKRMKVIPINPTDDIPVKELYDIFNKAKMYY